MRIQEYEFIKVASDWWTTRSGPMCWITKWLAFSQRKRPTHGHGSPAFLFSYILLGHNKYLFSLIFWSVCPIKCNEKKSVRLTSRIQIHYEWSKTQRKEIQRLRNLLLDHSWICAWGKRRVVIDQAKGLLRPGLDNTRLFISLTADAGTGCMSLPSSSPSLMASQSQYNKEREETLGWPLRWLEMNKKEDNSCMVPASGRYRVRILFMLRLT